MEVTTIALLAVLFIEMIFFLLTQVNKSVSNFISKHNVNVYPFMILIDLGKVPRFKSVSGSRKALVTMAVIGTVNFIALLYLFYRALIPSIAAFFGAVVSGGSVRSPFVPVVPGVTVSITQFIYILLALSIGVALHEFFHAIAAYAAGWRVEAWGVGLLLIFPLAYVRTNEEDFKEASMKAKAAVLTAGVLANTILFLVAMAAIPIVMAHVNTGVVILSLDTKDLTAPAVKAGLPTPSLLLTINNSKIRSIADLRAVLIPNKDKEVTYVVKIRRVEIRNGVAVLRSGVLTYILHKPAGRWRLGIIVTELPLQGTSPQLLALARFMYWFYIVNISLAVINAAPLYITDGGRLISELLRKYNLNYFNHIIQGLTAFFVIVFLVVGLFGHL